MMSAQPLVSVIMPVRNEEKYIERSLKSVLDQDYPRDRLEVIVADGSSDDKTREIVRRFAEKDTRVRLVENPKKIAAAGLNTAVTASRGEIVVRVDGHCEIASDYVRQCVSCLQALGAEGVGGPIETIGETFEAAAIAAAMSSSFGVGNAAFRTVRNKKMEVDTVAFPAYRRETLDRTGPFDETLVRNQDDEYNFRLRKQGGKIFLCPEIRSRYYSRGSLASLWRQYYEYGFWKVVVMRKHPSQMSARHFVPALWLAALITGALSAPFCPQGRAFFFAVLVSYAAMNLAVSSRIAAEVRKPWMFLLARAFLYLHSSYGAGFVTGIFAGRRP